MRALWHDRLLAQSRGFRVTCWVVRWALVLSVTTSWSAVAESSRFIEVAEAVGLDFTHDNGAQGRYLMPEIVGAGVALLDYDADGDLDVFVVQSGSLDADEPKTEAARDRLFRNQLIETGRLTFDDVTSASGIESAGYGMGATAADYDGDGDVDLYVTNLGSNQLWRNLGKGRFEDATESAGVDDRRWGVPAVFFDYDRDGFLDLYVGNYVDYSVAANKRCETTAGAPDYCGPYSYEPAGDRIWRNLGDGTFRDVTRELGLGAQAATLGAVATDFNGDGFLDLYVANDGMANHMWINQGGGKLVDEALLLGTALNGLGRPEAGMGALAADLDGDGSNDLFVAHLAGETNTLYLSDENGFFSDATATTGLAAPSLAYTAFGTAPIDFDNDGDLDLVTVNGAVHFAAETSSSTDGSALAQRNQMFENLGDATFAEVETASSSPLAAQRVSRGLAVGDIDNDGDTDLVVANNGGQLELVLNQLNGAVAWVGVELGTDALALGARVVISSPKTTRTVTAGGSYASSSDTRVLVGLAAAPGEAPAKIEITVEWSNGARSEHDVPVGRYSRVRLDSEATSDTERSSS